MARSWKWYGEAAASFRLSENSIQKGVTGNVREKIFSRITKVKFLQQSVIKY